MRLEKGKGRKITEREGNVRRKKGEKNMVRNFINVYQKQGLATRRGKQFSQSQVGKATRVSEGEGRNPIGEKVTGGKDTGGRL